MQEWKIPAPGSLLAEIKREGQKRDYV